MMAFLMRFLHRDGDDANAAKGESLHARRMLWQLRRYMIALLASVTVFCALQCIIDTTATRTVVVADRSLDAGTVLGVSDVAVVEAPAFDALDNALVSTDKAIGLTTQMPLEEGDILLASSVKATPKVGEQQTVIDVRLAAGQHPFALGTVVELRSMNACTEQARASPDGCVVSTRAIVMAEPRLDDSGASLTAMALDVDDAMAVLKAQEQGTLIAAMARA